MKNIYCAFILNLFLLSGCDQPPKSVSWYKEHPKEMNEKYADCKKSGDDTPDCRNVLDAHFNMSQLNAVIPNFSETKKKK